MGFPTARFQSEMSGAESDRKDRPNRRQFSLQVHQGIRAGMRLRPIFFATLALAATAWSAQAQTQGDEAKDHFEEALSQDCPQKQLQLLSARDLRDGLDEYVEGLPTELHDRVQKAETDNCSTTDAGAACVNTADIQAADEVGRIDDLALSICGSFLRCTDQGVCDYAR
jgi:hypothetical protein